MHLAIWQHPPLRHVLAAQHCCPDAPHTSQLPAPPSPPAMQMVPDVEQPALGRTQVFAVGSQHAPVAEQGAPVEQHTSPDPPHGAQVPPWHARPPPHVLLAQHGWPSPPHVVHEPPTQARLPLTHWLPAQHT